MTSLSADRGQSGGTGVAPDAGARGLRRPLARGVAKVGGLLLRLSRAIWRAPQDRRVEAWVRDGGDRTLRLDYDLDENSIVFDLGGYEGQWASDVFARYRCAVHVFEPVPEFAERIAARFTRNPRILLHRFALAAEHGAATITVDADRSSLHGGAGRPVPIALVRADDFLREHRIVRVDLMKINIEGGEYDLLEHLIEAGLVPRIRDLQVQFHDFVEDAARRMAAIQRRLAETHAPTYQYPFVWENWRLTRSAARSASSGTIPGKP